MAYPWPYSPRLYYDELVHDPHYERLRHARTHLAPSHWAVSDQHSLSSSARSPLYHREQIQPAEKTASLVLSHPNPMANGKNSKESTSRAMPAISFKAAIEKLKTTNSDAYEFFKKFHNNFKDETKAIGYTSQKVLDAIWENRVRKFETKHWVQPSEDQNQNGDQEEGRNGIDSGEQSFLELRDDLLRRCTMMQNVRVPNWLVTTPEDYEKKNSADAFVKHVNSSIQNMIPNLKKSDRDASAMKAAVQEMDNIRNFLETYSDAWEGEGVRRQEYDQEEEDK